VGTCMQTGMLRKSSGAAHTQAVHVCSSHAPTFTALGSTQEEVTSRCHQIRQADEAACEARSLTVSPPLPLVPASSGSGGGGGCGAAAARAAASLRRRTVSCMRPAAVRRRASRTACGRSEHERRPVWYQGWRASAGRECCMRPAAARQRAPRAACSGSEDEYRHVERGASRARARGHMQMHSKRLEFRARGHVSRIAYVSAESLCKVRLGLQRVLRSRAERSAHPAMLCKASAHAPARFAHRLRWREHHRGSLYA
jgi:hypothetical protein